MTDTSNILSGILDAARAADLGAICQFLKSNPSEPLVATGSGGSESAADFAGVKSFFFIHGSWGRPVAKDLESKTVETGIATGCICDYRNYCHGRFIHTSNHLADSAVVMFISPRERDIAARTRAYLPAKTKLVLIESEHDAPEASLDLLIRASEFFRAVCPVYKMDPVSPRNPGRIDKRKPMWVPFMAALGKQGPLSL